MKLFLRLLFLLQFLVAGFTSYAQDIISGTVFNGQNHESIPGVNVSVKGTTNATQTNSKGRYSLKAAPDAVLIFSFIGFESKQVVITSQHQIDVSLKSNDKEVGEIVVTGSRSAIPRTNISSPVPIDVISAKELKSYGQTDITQILNFIAPSFSSNRQTVSDGTDHVDPASLRGLGPDQVLVLVNGKRRHTSALVNINGTFGRGTVGTDLNSIPVSAIDHIEVLRDGAAAQYGSDAIAGVINIILKKVTPLTISSMYGQSASQTLGRTYTDGKTYQLDASKGWNLNNKGFVNISGQYIDRGATDRSGIDTRPLLYSSVSQKTGEPAADFQTRYNAAKLNDDTRANAAGLSRHDMRVGNAHIKNLAFVANAQYKLNTWADIYLAANYTHRNGDAPGFYRLPSQASQVDTTKYPNGYLPFINTSINDVYLSGGFKGIIHNWNYDLSQTFGENNLAFNITNTVNASLPYGTSPSSFYAGKLIFKQNTTNFDINRKFTFNGLLSSLNTAFGAEYRLDSYQINAGEELSYSFGQPSKNIPGRLVGAKAPAAAGSQVFPGFRPSNAVDKSRHNGGIYADIEGQFGPRLLVEAAGRLEKYSDFGSNFSYKFTGRYKIIDQLSVRGAVATGFRAPSLQQRYFNNESTQFIQGNPTEVLTVNNDSPIVSQFGVGSLTAEKSKDYSLGLSGQVGTFSYTIDAYQINIKNRIVFSSQFSRERKSNGSLDTSGAVNKILNTVDPNAQINSVQFFTNAIDTRTRGLDIVGTDRITLGAAQHYLLLTAGLNFNNTRVTNIRGSSILDANSALKAKLFDRQERSRFETSVPASKINLTAAYTFNKLNIQLRAVRFGNVSYLNQVDPHIAANNLPLNVDQTFTPKWVTDLSVSYKVLKSLTATAGINNIFDVYPDKLYIDPRNNQNNLSGTTTPASNYTSGRDNTSNGRFVYGRAVSQFGFNGRFAFAKLTLIL